MQRATGSGRGRLWHFVALAVAVFAILVAAGINGSSIGMLYTQQDSASSAPDVDDPDLLLGSPRAIRSDEWSIGTPLSVGQAAQDFPDVPWIGLTQTEATMSAFGLPVLGPTTVAKPQAWGYLLFGPERGLAWSWWFPFLLASCSVFALAFLITDRWWLSAGAALLASATPFVGWWTSPSPNLFVGFAALAAFAAIRGMLARSTVRGVLWGGVTGWAVAASALMLYPPWTVSTGLVAAALVVGVAIDIRVRLLRAVLVVAGAGAVAAAILVPWFLKVRPLIEITNATIYPGQRRSVAGDGVWQVLLSAPSNLVTAATGKGPAILNQSEVSGTWLPGLLIVMLAALVLVAGRRAAANPVVEVGKVTVSALVAVSALLLAWMFVPALPDAVGKVTMLSRVPGSRVPLSLGLAAVLLVVVLSTFDLARVPRWLLGGLLIVGVVASVAAASYAARQLYPVMGPKGQVATAVGAALIALGYAAIATGIGLRILLPLAVVYAVVSFGVVNPVYRGLGPLDHDPVSLYAAQVAQDEPGATAVTLGGRELQALVRGGGMQVQSWTTQYPDWRFWEKAMPGREDVWNNYRNYAWFYDAKAAPIDAMIVAPDAAELHVDLCDPVITDLGFSRVFSAEPVTAPCLTEDRVLDRGEQQIHVYRTVD